MALSDPEDRALQEQKAATLHLSATDIARAREAQALLENPLLNDSLNRIERTWEQAWRSTTPGDTEKREKAYRMLYALTEFRSELQSIIEGGKIAAKTMDSLESDRLGSTEPSDS